MVCNLLLLAQSGDAPCLKAGMDITNVLRVFELTLECLLSMFAQPGDTLCPALAETLREWCSQLHDMLKHGSVCGHKFSAMTGARRLSRLCP